MRLNIGSGSVALPDYLNIDRKMGGEAYPLSFEDESFDVIRASHVLEHFPHAQVPEVVKHWASKLKPGGVLKVAVPDFDWIAQEYLNGSHEPIEGYLMGGQMDEDDFHKSTFNTQTLIEYFRGAGLTDIGRWESDAPDCSSLSVSLNLRAVKPAMVPAGSLKIGAIMSVPRFGPTNNLKLSLAFRDNGIGLMPFTGAYWGQCMERGLDAMIAEGQELIFTADYDSQATAQNVQTLMRLMLLHPEADAICALQMARGWKSPLLTMDLPEGVTHQNVPRAVLDQDLVKLKTGHFGLTVFRASALKEMPKPWLVGIPAPDGSWGEGRTDDDIYFWRKWAELGKTLFCAMRVPIGHQEEIAIWPGRNLQPVYQRVAEFWTSGPPKDAWR